MAKKRLIYILAALIAIAAIYFPGFAKLRRLRKQNSNLERRMEILSKTNEELRKEKEKLENDPVYIEKIAREKLGMIRRDEIILK